MQKAENSNRGEENKIDLKQQSKITLAPNRTNSKQQPRAKHSQKIPSNIRPLQATTSECKRKLIISSSSIDYHISGDTQGSTPNRKLVF